MRYTTDVSKSTERTAPKRLRIVIPTIILLIWLVLGSVGGPYFGKISDVATNDQTTFLPASAESTQVSGELEKFQDEKSIPTILVFTDGDKILPDDTITKIKDETAKLSSRAEVVGEVSPPITSDDGKAALVVVNVSSDVKYDEFVPELRSTLDAASLPAQFKVTGPVGFLYDLAVAFAGIDGILLGVALAVVFIILLIVYRSPVLPFVVLLNSIFALSAVIPVVYYLAKADLVTLNGQVQGILFILVIGAATDYALLYTARYREELMRHDKPYQALLVSWRRSLEPILAAGGTVTAGLLCLLLSDLNSNKALGPVGAIGIGFAIISALTLLPSLLLMWGRKAFWPRVPRFERIHAETTPKKGLWPRTARFVGTHGRGIWISATLVLVVASAGLLQLKADGVAQSDLILGSSEARDGQQQIDQHFPGGSGTPAQIILPANKLDQVVSLLEADKGVASVTVTANNSSSGTLPLGREAANIKQKIRDEVVKDLDAKKAELRTQIEAQSPGLPGAIVDQIYDKAAANIPSVDSVADNAYPFKDATPKVVHDEVLVQATLSDNADSEAAQSTIKRLRDTLHTFDSSAHVGGSTATALDTRISAEHDREVVIPAVLVVITLILMVLLRSVLAPILLLLTTILSFAATLGVSALLFNHLWNFPGADPSVVLYGFIFLVALGIDYNIFLMTRVREESLRLGTRRGVLVGLIVTGGVITSAGIVLAATFAALAVIPILFLAQLAFIVAFGVLLDTILVRSLLVPALVHDIGNRVWWPSRKFNK